MTIATENFSALANATSNAIFIIEGETIVFSNPTGLKLLGALRPDQVVGQKFTKFQHSDYYENTKRRFKNALERNETAPLIQQKFIRLDGLVIDVETISVADTYRGRPAIHAAVRDVTERNRLAHALSTIGKLSDAMRAVASRQEVLKTFLDIMSESFSADGAAMVLANGKTGAYVNGFSRGVLSDPDVLLTLTSEKLMVELSESKKICTNFASSHTILPDDCCTETLAKLPASYFYIGVPLVAEQSVVSVLWLARSGPFTEFEIALLESIRTQAGTNIQRATLADQARQNLSRMESLHRIERAINTSFDLQLTLDVVLEQVATELEVDAVDILVPDEFNVLRYKAGRGFSTKLVTNASIKVGESRAGKVALNKQMIKVPLLTPASEDTSFAEMVVAEQFASYFAAPLQSGGEFVGVLEVYNREPLNPDSRWFDFLETVGEQTAIAIKNSDLFLNLQQAKTEIEIAYQATLSGWVRALEMRDGETSEHTQRVTAMCVQLARAMNYPEKQLAHLWRGALLHDIGKIALPDSILRKPGALNETEWDAMKKHPDFAWQMLMPINYLRPALDIPYCHHEKWDGSGYPRGLAGEQIPLAARIFAIVDVWDALRSNRPYRKAMSDEQAWVIIRKQAGTHFDPKVVSAFQKEFIES